MIKVFFTAHEVAEKLSTPEQSASVNDVLRLAEEGSLPVCFRYSGDVGVFERPNDPIGFIFGRALRHIYLPAGSYLRTRRGVELERQTERISIKGRLIHSTQAQVHALNPREVQVVAGLHRDEGVSLAEGEALWITRQSMTQSGDRTRWATFSVPLERWLFHADDVASLADGNSGPTAADATAKGKQSQRWTPEALAELRQYRDRHTEAQTAAHFKVSGAYVRKLLASMKQAASGAGMYGQLSR